LVGTVCRIVISFGRVWLSPASRIPQRQSATPGRTRDDDKESWCGWEPRIGTGQGSDRPLSAYCATPVAQNKTRRYPDCRLRGFLMRDFITLTADSACPFDWGQ
jgi:hypothetical protein